MKERKVSDNVLYFLFIIMTGFWSIYAIYMCENGIGNITRIMGCFESAFIGFAIGFIVILSNVIRQKVKGFVSFSKTKLITGIVGAVIISIVFSIEGVQEIIDDIVYSIDRPGTIVPCIILVIIWTVLYVTNMKKGRDLLFDDDCEVITAIMFGTVGSIIPFLMYMNY